ncbi:MAG: TnpV protein [Eubacteriales bacterium]|nr:TnpV protein [Eubacteriales bacterium]
MTLTYKTQGDFQIPELSLPKQPEVTLGKYAMLRRKFLINHRKGLYLSLKASGKLTEHLREIEQTALSQMDSLISQMKKTEGVTEQMKATDQMRWVGLMNSIKHSAEETVLSNLIYS